MAGTIPLMSNNLPKCIRYWHTRTGILYKLSIVVNFNHYIRQISVCRVIITPPFIMTLLVFNGFKKCR